MQEEINEILDRLERIDYKEYSCAFEFADRSTFDEIGRCFDERKKMADYITNLQDTIDKIIKYIDNSSLTIKSHYFSDILNIIGDFYENNEK